MNLINELNSQNTAMFQYRFDIDIDDSEVRFALTQQVKNEGEKNHEPLVTIGMHLMRVEDNRIYRIHQVCYFVTPSQITCSEGKIVFFCRRYQVLFFIC